MATTLAQQKAVAIAPKFTAALSVISSSLTSYLILRRHKRISPGSGGAGKRTRSTYHRLVLGMSLCDVIASSAWFFTTWPIPSGTSGVYQAFGNQKACTAQAFFAQFSLSTVMYNASLSIYYFLVIVKGWKDRRVNRVEPYFHVHALAWGLGTSVASLSLGLFNQVGWDCWISASPLGCEESWDHGGRTTCERGDNGSIYQWAFYYAPLWFVIVLVTGLMCWIYYGVRSQETTMRRYGKGELRQTAVHAKMTRSFRRSSKIAKQAFYYVASFYASWLFPTIFQAVLVSSDEFPFWLLFLTAFSVPVQGFFNLLVFMRPTYVRYQKDHPEEQFFLTRWLRMMRSELRGRDDDDDDRRPPPPPRVDRDDDGGGNRAVVRKTFRPTFLRNTIMAAMIRKEVEESLDLQRRSAETRNDEESARQQNVTIDSSEDDSDEESVTPVEEPPENRPNGIAAEYEGFRRIVDV